MREREETYYRSYFPKIYRRCQQLLLNHEEAEDAAQEVFLKMIENLDGFRGEAHILSWLYTITNYHCYYLLKRKNRWNKAVQDELVRGRIEAAEFVQEDRMWFDQLLAETNPRTRQAVCLYYWGGMTQEEISQKLDIPRSTIKRYLGKFVQEARQKLEDELKTT